MYWKTIRSTGRYIPKYDENGDLNDVSPTHLIENEDCETCQECGGIGCETCDFEGYIDFSEPNGMN